MTQERLLCTAAEMDIEKTFECGQCFRWTRDSSGVYSGIAYGVPARLRCDGENVYISSPGSIEMWREYFDLERDYRAIADSFNAGDYLDRCIDFGFGIRILRQEPWEALCSFIISQCNNISRIKSIVSRLCAELGESVEFDGELFYKFPTAERLAGLTAEDLAFLRSGYRAPYIIGAAKSLASGETKMESLIEAPWQTAKAELKKLSGIGDKVANCVVLFGLYHMEAFPIDVWIKRALKEHFAPGFDPQSLGEYAGIAQQYIFYYARSTDNAG